MQLLSRYIRHVVLISSLILGVIIYFIAGIIWNTMPLQYTKLTQIYAFTAIFYLYAALLVSPLLAVFPKLPFLGLYHRARRAIGVSAFYFSLLHAGFAFFWELAGFPGLPFLGNKYLLAIGFSFTALMIMAVMAATSFDKIVAKLTFPKWKKLHRLIYLGGVLILIHAMMLGTHFQNLASLVPKTLFVALAFLLFLESIRFDRYLTEKYQFNTRFGITTGVMIAVIMFGSVYLFLPQSQTLSLGIHAQHIQIAKEAQQGNSAIPSNINIPGLRGDKTRRYTVSFFHDDVIKPQKDTQLSFTVYDASSGNPIFLFDQVYGKTMHLIIVDNELKYFTHIHPDYKNKTFTITTQFPKDGFYHLYIDFQPLGAIEQQFAFSTPVGDISNLKQPDPTLDSNLTKDFGDYKVALSKPNPLSASEMSIGNQILTFTLYNSKTGQPIKTLKPYLQAFGHLVLINEKTFDYMHVHPTNILPVNSDSTGGPKVDFQPLGLYGPIKPGIYRVFAQFNPDDNLMVADYTIQVE